jgi:hypothetical protein
MRCVVSFPSSILSAEVRLASPGQVLARAAAGLPALIRSLDRRLDARNAEAARHATRADLFAPGLFQAIKQAD